MKGMGKRKKKALFLYDDNGNPTRAGDVVRFGYGTPTVEVEAKVIRRGRSLIVLTPGHNPAEGNLRALRRHVGEWYKKE